MPYTRKFDQSKEDSPFAKNLRMLLKNTKTSQAKIADYVGCTQQAIAAYQRGETVPNVTTAALMAKFFGVSLDYLAGLTDISSPDPDVISICHSTRLIQEAAEKLKEIDNPCILAFLDDIITKPNDLLEKVAKAYISYIHVKYVIEPAAKNHAEDLKEKKVLTGIVINGEELPHVPIQDQADYARFELTRRFINLIDDGTFMGRREVGDNGKHKEN